jgi:hypothetical protein
MNKLEPVVVARMYELFAQSFGVRAVAETLQISKNTAAKYLRQIPTPRCDCGRPVTHNGFCTVRYRRSERRQEFMQRWHPSSIGLTELTIRRALDAMVRTNGGPVIANN